MQQLLKDLHELSSDDTLCSHLFTFILGKILVKVGISANTSERVSHELIQEVSELLEEGVQALSKFRDELLKTLQHDKI